MKHTIETTSTPSQFRATVARVRVYAGEGETMRIGFNALAASYLATDVVRKYLGAETGVTVSEAPDVNPQETPYVNQAFEVSPPLNDEQLRNLGAQLVDGTFTEATSLASPEGVMLIDSRGKYVPTSPIDNGGSVHGEINSHGHAGAIIAQRDLRPQFAAA